MNEFTAPEPDTNAAAEQWLVYIIEASDGSLYTGVTTDIERRWRQHSEGAGARFFRGRSPRALVFIETGHDRGSALRREVAIKKLRRAAKLELIANAEKQTADTLCLEEVPAAKVET